MTYRPCRSAPAVDARFEPVSPDSMKCRMAENILIPDDASDAGDLPCVRHAANGKTKARKAIGDEWTGNDSARRSFWTLAG